VILLTYICIKRHCKKRKESICNDNNVSLSVIFVNDTTDEEICVPPPDYEHATMGSDPPPYSSIDPPPSYPAILNPRSLISYTQEVTVQTH
jgi:hypothetical protein